MTTSIQGKYLIYAKQLRLASKEVSPLFSRRRTEDDDTLHKLRSFAH